MTEDAENVFLNQPVPYLKSTTCSLEKQPEYLIEAKQPVLTARINDRDITGQITPLLALGLIVPGNGPDYFDQAVSIEEIENSLALASSQEKLMAASSRSNFNPVLLRLILLI